MLAGSPAAAFSAAPAGSAAPPHEADIARALERFRATIPKNFQADYVENAVIPFFLTSIYEGERPLLPMIDVTFTKENALPYDLWGLIYKIGSPPRRTASPSSCRGSRSAARTISASGSISPAVTPDLYRPMYRRQGRRLLRQAAGSEICRQAVHAALSRLLFRPLLGPAPWREG